MGTFTVAEYAAKLAAAGKQINPRAEAILVKAGQSLRAEWKGRAAAANRVHAVRYPDSIVMRRVIVDSDGVMLVRVEPASYSQGKLGYILERGKGRNAAQMNDVATFEAQRAKLLQELADAMTKPLI
jgi:hypothetical protein